MQCVDWGSLHAAVSVRAEHAGGRGAVVARKPVKAGGAKGARKVDASMSHDVKNNPAEVPAGAVLPGEADPYGWVERAVWTERMLDALRRGGPEGGRWKPSSPHRGSSRWRRPTRGTSKPIGGPTDWRAVCGKSARTVRREGWPG